jgi:hypothetical protein
VGVRVRVGGRGLGLGLTPSCLTTNQGYSVTEETGDSMTGIALGSA